MVDTWNPMPESMAESPKEARAIRDAKTQPGHAGDACQRLLVPRSRCRQQLMLGVSRQRPTAQFEAQGGRP
jgi:hypothetical protein